MSDFVRKIIVRNAGTELRQLLGVNIDVGATETYPFAAFGNLVDDNTILEDITSGDLVINDGNRDLNPEEASVYITNTPIAVTATDEASGEAYAIKTDTSGQSFDDGTSTQTYDETTLTTVRVVNQPKVEELGNVNDDDTRSAEGTESFGLVKLSDGTWDISPPKLIPANVGNTVNFFEDFTTDEDNVNDILNFGGNTSSIITLFNPINILDDLTLTIRNEGTAQLIIQALDEEGEPTEFTQRALEPDANLVIFNKGTKWFIKNDTVQTTSRVRDLEISLGYLDSSIVSGTTSEISTIDPARGNNWILTVDTDSTLNIKISENPDNQTYIAFSITLIQDSTGEHQTTFLSNLNLRWHENREPTFPKSAESLIQIEFESFDSGATWYAISTLVYDAKSSFTENPDMVDKDTARRTIGSDPTEIGLSLSSNINIASGNLFYRILANSTSSTTAEVQILVDGIVRSSFTTPSFFQDELVTQDVEIDETWEIYVGSVIEIFFRETSGALTIEVKGDVQESVLSITNIVEGSPPPDLPGVEDGNDHLLATTNTDIGLNWTNDTGDGFLSADMILELTVGADITSSIVIETSVDDVVRYSDTVGGIFEQQRLRNVIPIDESWQVLSSSVIKTEAREGSGGDSRAINMTVYGSVTESVMNFDNIVPGDPSEGGGDALEDTNSLDVDIPTGTDEPILNIESGQVISSGTLDFTIGPSSNFATSCKIDIDVDGVEKFTETITGVNANITDVTRQVIIDSSWNITDSSNITLTCREGSGNPSVVLTINGSQLLSIMTITPS